MSSTPNVERIYVNIYSHGLGEKRAKGQGHIGIEKLKDEIKLTIGRGGVVFYNNPLVSAWVKLSKSQAHELAMGILYQAGIELPCNGEGVKQLSHKTNLSMSVSFEADLCSVLARPAEVKKDIMDKVSKDLDQTLELYKKEIK